MNTSDMECGLFPLSSRLIILCLSVLLHVCLMISIVSYVLISYLTLLFHALSIISQIACCSHAQEHLADKSLAMKGEGKCLLSHPWQTISSSL